MLIIVCKAHSVIVLILVTVKVVGIKVENHIFGLFGSIFRYRRFDRLFLFGSLFNYRLFCRNVLFGSLFCYGLFCRYILFGSLFSHGLFCRNVLNGSLFSHRHFCGYILYGSFLCRRFHSSLFSLFLRLLFSEALLYLVKEIGGVFSSASGFLFFLSDLFLDSLASGSLSFFFFFSEQSLLLSLLTSLGRSHRTLFSILLELLSVIISILKGRQPFLVQAL